MHTGSRAFCFLMALAATGAECASASPSTPVQVGIESKLVAPAQPLSAAVVPETMSMPGAASLGMVLRVVIKPHLEVALDSKVRLSLGSARYTADAPNASSILSLRSISLSTPFDCGFNRTKQDRQTVPRDYHSNGRVMASIADANERQLLFVKITRG